MQWVYGSSINGGNENSNDSGFGVFFIVVIITIICIILV